MPNIHTTQIFCSTTLYLWSAFALAEETDGTPTDTEAGTILVEDSREKTQGASTVLTIDEKIASQQNLGNLLRQTTGSYVREIGGIASYSSVSIRGATSQQTLISLNGIPLNPDGVNSINIQEIPLQALQTVTVYRNNPPLELQSSNIGGAISLESKTSFLPSLLLHTGSFGTYGAQATIAPKKLGNIFASFVQTQGDYTYWDNNATPFSDTDDAWRTRNNNHKNMANWLYTNTMGNWNLLHTSLWRQEGIPGNIHAPTLHTALETSRHLTGLEYATNHDGHKQSTVLWNTIQQEILSDPAGELSIAGSTQTWNFWSVGGKNFQQWNVGDFSALSLGIQTRYEQAQQNETTHQRSVHQLQLGHLWLPTTRLEWENSIQEHALLYRETLWNTTAKSNLSWHQITPNQHQRFVWLSLSKNFRPPDFTEMFGNRGAIVGNPDLLPETSENVDIGWMEQTDTWNTQLGYFIRHTNDQIVFVQNAQRQSLPLNFTETMVQGVEASARYAPVEWIELQGNLTYTHSRNLSDITALYGKQLPNTPQLVAQQSISFIQNDWVLGENAYFIQGNYWDAVNQNQTPARHIVNAFLRRNLSRGKQLGYIELDGRNLLNTQTAMLYTDPLQPNLGKTPYAIEDFLGYPLPGRHVLLSVSWTPNP